MKTKRKTKEKNKNKTKTKTKTKKIKIIKIDKNNIKKINNVYQNASLYKDTAKLKKVQGKDINKIIDEKMENLLKLFDDERLKNISPKEDFHQLTNISWINGMNQKKNKTNDTAYYTQFDNFRITQDKVYYRLIQYVQDYIKHNKNKLSTCLKNVYFSWKNLNSKTIQQHFHKSVTDVDKCQKNTQMNVWQFLAKLNENEFIAHSLPFQWSLKEDKKNTKLFANYITSPKLGLYDLDIYFDEEKKEERNKYIAFINRVFDACFQSKKHGFKGEYVFEIECNIVQSFGCNIVQENKEYNKVFLNESFKKYSFDWKELAISLGYKKIPSFFICNNLNYLTCMSKTLVDNWRNEKWSNYWVFIHFIQMIRFHPKHRVLYYEYYEKELFGQNALFPDEIYPIFGLTITFHHFLTEQYRKNNLKQEYIDYTKRMATNMQQLLLERLKKNKWLTPSTKAYASKKIKKIHICIDSCNEIQKDPLLNYEIDDAWENMQKIFQHRHQVFLSYNNRPTKDIEFSQVDWKSFHLSGTQTYIVNAFYIPSFNRIYIPLAYLQSPFIDLDDRGIEYNLANIGFILAHEFSHSLDEIGSKHDENGNLYDWWTKEDKNRYKKIMEDINAQYTKAMSYQDIKTDVSFYLGENIADITGLSLCSDYLILYHSVKQNLESVSTTFLSLKTFYNYYAIQMRQHVAASSMDMLLKTNPHPPDKYRINCPLSRLFLFNKIFDVQKGNKMYWDDKVKVW